MSITSYCYVTHVITLRAGIVQSVQQLAIDSPGTESRWQQDFPHLARPALAPTQPHVLYNKYWVSFPEERHPGCVTDQPQRLKKEYSNTSTPPSRPAWPALECTLPYTIML